MEQNVKKQNKHTAYFYIAIVIMLIAIVVCYYHYSALQKTIDSYVEAGYELSQVLEYYPYTNLIPTIAETLAQFGAIAAILFVADTLVIKLRPLEDVSRFISLFEEEDEGCECGCEECGCGECADEGVVVATAEPEETEENK